MIRIKLIFDDNILIAEEYRKIWFLIPDTVHYVSDLVYLIKTKFSLKNTSSKGLYLVLDEFTLPFTQNIQLIRENDVIIVKNKTPKQKIRANVEAPSSSCSASDDSSASESAESVQHHATHHAPTATAHATQATARTNHTRASSVSAESSDSDDSEHVINTPNQSRAIADTNKKQSQRLESASHVPPVPPQRRGESLGRGYRAPQWPWLPFTLASHTDTCHSSQATAPSSVSLNALQREDVIAFRTMELEGWQPVLSPVKQATVRAVTPHSLTVRLLTGVTAEAEEVTLAAADLIDLTVVNKHS